MILSTAPAQATTTSVVCTGFTGCVSLGRSAGGYASVYKQSFWSMTAGHNCTNYIAYRLSHGRKVVRPAGTSSAVSWGPAAAAAGIPVDDTPAPGAVAWWAAGHNGASATAGHVAYVEAVLLDGAMIVSEDNLNGDFRWRIVTRLGGGWPSGFIHYAESDGSPAGDFLSVTSPAAGRLDFWGTSMDPDAEGGDRSYRVTLVERGGSGRVLESFTFGSPWFRFHWINNVATRGRVTMKLYALNEPGTAGRDTPLGQRDVTIRSSSSVSASMVDSSISTRRHPRVRVSLAPGRAAGSVDIKRGSTLLKRVTLAAGARTTVTLPRQRKGLRTLSVRYRGSTTYAPSAKSVRVRVR